MTTELCCGWDSLCCRRTPGAEDEALARLHGRSATRLLDDLASNGAGARFVVAAGRVRLKAGADLAPCGVLVDALRDKRAEIESYLLATTAGGVGWGGQDLPILHAYAIDNADGPDLAVWCDSCCRYHFHGRDPGWPESERELIRVAHCNHLANQEPRSYAIRLAGSLDAAHGDLPPWKTTPATAAANLP